MADFLSRAMEPIEANTVTYLAAIFADGLSEQYRDDQDSDRESNAQDSDGKPNALDTDTDNPECPVYKKPRRLAVAGASDSEEEIEFTRHKAAPAGFEHNSMRLSETQLAAISPAQSIKQALDEVHHDRLGHKGALATWKEVHRRYQNLSVSLKQVSAYLQDCGTCRKIRATPSDPMTMQKSLPVFHARAITHVDMLTLPEDKEGYAYAYVFVNAFTKYTLIFRAKDKTAQHAATAILQHASIVELTQIIWSDNGSEFVSETSTAVAKAMGSTWQYTVAYRPQANSHVERVNGEILRHIRGLLTYEDTWNSWSPPSVISLTQMAINTRVHSSTGYTPVELT